MVLLLAALYQMYKTHQQFQQQHNNNNTAESCNEEEETGLGRTTTSRFVQKIQNRGSALLHHSVLRCSPLHNHHANTTTDDASSFVYSSCNREDHPPSERRRTHSSSTTRTATSHSDEQTTTMHSSSISPDVNTTGVEEEAVDIFQDSIKNDWIDAVFGPAAWRVSSSSTTTKNDNPEQPKKYTQYNGVAGTAYTRTMDIPVQSNNNNNNHNNNNDKLGITISRLAIGLYVRNVQGEAAFAGIRPGSILISMNHLPVLAEPSKDLIQRLWQYEGYFYPPREEFASSRTTSRDFNKEEKTSRVPSSLSDSTIMTQPYAPGAIREPVALQFFQAGQVYTVLMLSNPPWGIQWAPVANVPLVKRVYGLAAQAGVKPGSLLAAVNGKSFRDMDHIAMAKHIRHCYEHASSSSSLQITLAFTPATARAGHYERPFQTTRSSSTITSNDRCRKSPPPSKKYNGNYDGVEIKFLPLGYAIGSLCASEQHVFRDRNHDSSVFWDDWAERIAAGRTLAPVLSEGTRRHSRLLKPFDDKSPTGFMMMPMKYLPCPALPTEQLLEVWNPLDSLLFCLRFYGLGYDGDLFHIHYSFRKSSPSQNTVDAIRDLLSGHNGIAIATAHLLQLISLICAPGISNSAKWEDEKKMDEPHLLFEISRQDANDLTSILLKLSRKDADFCQKLYFYLRSYISTFETSPPPSTSNDGSKNLMALLNCLELLRFAEKELSGRITDQRSPSSPSNRNEVASARERQGLSARTICSKPTSSPISPRPHSPDGVGFRGQEKKKQPSVRASSKIRHISPQRLFWPTADSHKNTSHQSKELCSHGPTGYTVQSLIQSPSIMYDNMSDFLTELDKICSTIERSLQKSFRQKIADWARQPWSAGKDAVLAEVTADMRQSLEAADKGEMLLVNPVDPSELLSSVDYKECYILPSAHFPILLTFNVSERRCSDSIVGEAKRYRTTVQLVSLRADFPSAGTFSVHAGIAGSLAQSGESSSMSNSCTHHAWKRGGTLVFESRSSWGAPQTLSLRICGKQKQGEKQENGDPEVGLCWIDLSEQWKKCEYTETSITMKKLEDVWPNSSITTRFDEQGEPPDYALKDVGQMQLELRITTECIALQDTEDLSFGDGRKRMLLYKHNDDLRQEAFAMQFIRTCNDVLKASGLDLHILSYECVPVGIRRGFVEWVPGSVPLSEICSPDSSSSSDIKSTSKFENLHRIRGEHNESLRNLVGGEKSATKDCVANDPIQYYLRSVAFDPKAPYLIRRDVMDAYVKSCAGYSVITYILGVGDRHLDNLLLHQSGSFFHCDYSFILGSDPKKYLPMRITEDMVCGMGGRESDNYAKFLSLVGAAFLALRRPENVRIILSMIRLVKASCLPDVSQNQATEQAILGVRRRLRLDLSDSQAITFIEGIVDESLSNKLWIAVDAIHQIGKKF